MRISVFGIGYVGAVSAACLARDGSQVVAVDVNPGKVADILDGRSPIVEEGLEELIRQSVGRGRLTATGDAKQAVAASEMSFVCVGTPSAANGSLDVSYLVSLSQQLGAIVREKNDFHSLVYRSTMLPGTMNEIIIPTLEQASGKKSGADFGVAYYPEFLRESSAIKDYDDPGTIVFGVKDRETHLKLEKLHEGFAKEPIVVDITTAEAVKYANNAWHAVKISFANEIGNISKAAGIDGHSVMSILCADRRLNISTAYLMPGFAFGGSCLPKDLRALRYGARRLDVPTPILDAALAANENQLERAYSMIAATGCRNIGVIGLSFKAGTDDLRESPFVELVERLHGRGFNIKIFDPHIQMHRLTGANLQYVRSRLPHIATMLETDVARVLHDADVVVVCNATVAKEAMQGLNEETQIVDLVRMSKEFRSDGSYQGICW